MQKIGISLIDVLIPPANPWLCQLIHGKTELPVGVRVFRHDGNDKDAFERNERLWVARRKLHEFVDGLE